MEKDKRIRFGAVAALQDENGRLLMMLRAKNPAKGMWAIPGGKVEFLEKVEDTLKREFFEELNINIKIEKFLGNIEDISLDEEEHWIMPAYIVVQESGDLKNVEPEKHLELKWFDLNEVPENISFMTKKVIKLIKNNK